MACLTLAALLALTVCTGAALAYCQPEVASAIAVEGFDPLYCHGNGHGHHGGHGRHSDPADCGWLFHACGDCVDVNCTNKDHAHRCLTDCTDAEHCHYNVYRYADGTLELKQRLEACDWLFHACGRCVNVNCTDEAHAHRCPADCTNTAHHHYGVCHYSDGTLTLGQKKA